MACLETLFVGEGSQVEGFRSAEAGRGEPWVAHGDAAALAGVLHALLFGRYMQVHTCFVFRPRALAPLAGVFSHSLFFVSWMCARPAPWEGVWPGPRC